MFSDVLFGKKSHSRRECRLVNGEKKLKVQKGLNHVFCQKLKNLKFFFSILGVDKVFGDVLKSKQSTLEEKNVHL